MQGFLFQEKISRTEIPLSRNVSLALIYLYRQRKSMLSPAGSTVDYGVRFFLGEEDVEMVKTSIEVRGGKNT